MKLPRPAPRLTILAVALVALIPAATPAATLHTVERTFHTYARGDQTFTCLLLGDMLVPLSPPYDARLTGSDENLTLTWQAGQGIARLRPATVSEVALLGQPGLGGAKSAGAKAEEWNRVALAGLPAGALAPGFDGLEPDPLPVNNWHNGLVTYHYSLGGQNFSYLLLVSRSPDGTVLAASLNTLAADYPAHRKALLGMLGAAVPVPVNDKSP